MTLGDFINRIKMAVPNLGETGVTDAYLATLFNQSVNEVNLITKVYSGYTDFDIEANKRIYNLSVSVPTYLGTDKRGLFFLLGTEWQKIDPKTEAYLSENFQAYLNAASVEQPNYYWINGDELGFYPAPSTSRAAGARLYHLKKATVMGNSAHYPFTGSNTEITVFSALDDAIIDWVNWKLKPAYGAVTDTDLGYRRFLESCRKGAMQIKRRRDLTNSNSTGMRT
jgi:hypothetical protein